VIVDVAHALAVRLTEARDPAAARAAAARGLEVEPGSELLYRDLFRAEHRAGECCGYRGSRGTAHGHPRRTRP
jgi:hypothetical protein